MFKVRGEVMEEDKELWVPLDITCEHCGKPLEVTKVRHSRIELAGHYTFKYRHADDKRTQCVVCEVRKVKPYSSWGVTKLYEDATPAQQESDE